MNSEECILISDEEEEIPKIVGTDSNHVPQDDSSNMVCMPEFVSVPSTSSNMESEMDYITAPAKLASTESSNFIEITKSDLKKSIKKNDLIIKIDGTLNQLNINAIMSVIKLYNFQNAGKFFFVKSSNPNEDINVNDLICHETLPNKTTPDQESSIPQPSQKLNVICKANQVKARTVGNHNSHQVFTTTTTHENPEKKKREIDKLNKYRQNIQSKLNRVKPITDELGKASNQNSETAVRHVDNDHSKQNQISFNQNNQNIYNRIRVKPFDQIGIASHQNVDTTLDHTNQNQINIKKSNAQKVLYKIRVKPLEQISKASHQVAETAVSTDTVRTQNNSSLQKARQLQESEHDPKMSLLKVSKTKYRSINWNNNTEWNNNDDLEYAPSSTNLNVFSVKTKNNDSVLQNDPINYEPIQQNSSNLSRFCSVSKNKVGVRNAGRKAKSRTKNKLLQSFYEKKYKLKVVKIAVSRFEVENYFARKRLKENLSFSQEQTLPNVNPIFIHDHNFESMTHYYSNEIPANTQLYFVNKHNITTSLYMKSFPLFAKAIKSNKIKVISESTYKKYQPTAKDKLIIPSSSFITKRKAQKFCKFVSDFHCSLGIKQNPFLQYIKLDHNYSVAMI